MSEVGAGPGVTPGGRRVPPGRDRRRGRTGSRAAHGTEQRRLPPVPRQEWGGRSGDDAGLFERLSLEAFQSGLSWLTILRKRENFRNAFAGFDPATVAGFGTPT